MVKKIMKYAKFMLCIILMVSLIAPSYAALSASDGSAFVTKAEFDSALADFNARLTTFEAGINSKIDSQVTSYLDRNGIWNGASQELWRYDLDPMFDYRRSYIASMAATDDDWLLADIAGIYDPAVSTNRWLPFTGSGGNSAIPLIKNITKSGLLAYNIPLLWLIGNAASASQSPDLLLTFIQTDLSNITSNVTSSSLNIYFFNHKAGVARPKDGLLVSELKVVAPYFAELIDKTQADYFSTMFFPGTFYTGSYFNQGFLGSQLNSDNTTTNKEKYIPVDPENGIKMSDIFTQRTTTGWAGADNETKVSRTYWVPIDQQLSTSYYGPVWKNSLYSALWSGSKASGNLKWTTGSTAAAASVTILSGYTFVKKGKALLIAPGCGGGWLWSSKELPITTNWIRTSGATLQLDIY